MTDINQINQLISIMNKAFTFIKITILSMCTVFISCNKTEIETPAITPQVLEKRYALQPDFEIIEKKLYADSSGEDLPFSLEKIKSTWETIDGRYLPQLIILKKDSIFFCDKENPLTIKDKCKYRVSQDSIFQEGQNQDNPSIHFSIFIGMYNPDQSIKLCKRYYYYLRFREDQMNSRYGNWYGFEKFDDVFHENGFFKSPKEINKGDTIAWCNVIYNYNLKHTK